MSRPDKTWAAPLASILIIALVLAVIAVSCSLRQTVDGTEGSGGGFVMRWHREGGIAGFCNDVTIYASGMATVASCRTQPATIVAEVSLTAEEQRQIDAWQTALGSWTREQSDEAIADQMTIVIEFAGAGSGLPNEATFAAMSRLAQTLLGRAG